MSYQGKLLVAALDFGTTYSGYAFSFKHDYNRDPTLIRINQAWSPGGTELMSMKTPTAILFTPDRQFNAFGFEAESKYAELALDEEHHEWYYFHRFKMILHQELVRLVFISCILSI